MLINNQKIIKLLLLLLILLASNFDIIQTSHHNYSVKKGLTELIEKVFKTEFYNPLVRPIDPESGLTVVSTELKIIQIDIDEKYQELVSTVWMEMSWVDQRLRWDPTEFGNITEITLPVSKLWTPDIVLQNGVGRNEYLKEMNYFNPWIASNGFITWVPEIRIHTRCLINVADFPFDTQCCEINFYSWAHTIKQMKIQQYGNKNVTNITHLSSNSEWLVYHTSALSKIIETSEELLWWVNSYIIRIKRHTTYHIYNLIMPCLILSILSMLLFLLPPDSGEKITLGVTILLAFFVNSLVVSNYTPEATTDLPLIGFYYVFNIALLSISIGMEVCVLNFHFREHKERVPKWVFKILFIKDERKKSNNEQSNIKSIQSKNNTLIHVNKINSPLIMPPISTASVVVKNNSNTNNNQEKKKKINLINCNSYNEMNNNFKFSINSKNNQEQSFLSNRKIKKSKTNFNVNSNNNNLDNTSIDIVKEIKTMNLNSSLYDFSKSTQNNDNQQNSIQIVYEQSPNYNQQQLHYHQNHQHQHHHLLQLQKAPDSHKLDVSQNIEYTLKLLQTSIQNSLNNLNKKRIKLKHGESIRDEWRKVSNRIDFILFLLSASIVTITPIILFGKFFFVNLHDNVQQKCGT